MPRAMAILALGLYPPLASAMSSSGPRNEAIEGRRGCPRTSGGGGKVADGRGEGGGGEHAATENGGRGARSGIRWTVALESGSLALLSVDRTRRGCSRCFTRVGVRVARRTALA